MSPVDDFVLRSATSYLQSVVFVDDKIYAKHYPVEVSAADSINGTLAAPPTFVAREAIPEAAVEQSPSVPKVGTDPCEQTEQNADVPAVQPPYHPRELMESFAQKGIICALYEPKKDFETDEKSELFKLCDRADVIILDWDLFNDRGAGVTELLSVLIKVSQEIFPHHTRLCAIYTDTPNLVQVMSELHGRLKIKGCPVDVEEGKLRLVAGATRVCVFGKPGSVGRPSDCKYYEVKETDLAVRVIAEFASLHHGVLPAFALHGLAAVRRNTKRFLDKLRPEMDGAFLLHRALALESTEAFDQLPELLADEIRAVLEDAWPPANLAELAESRVESLAIKESSPPWTKDGLKIDATPILKDVLRKGGRALTEHRDSCVEIKNLDKKFRNAPAKSLLNFADLVSESGQQWSDHLAALFCCRTQYDQDTRTIRFGTVVRHREIDTKPWEFSLCLMPICDSQRLKKNTPCSFPFWRLKEDARCGKDGKRNGIVAVDREGSTHCLAAGGKIRDHLWLALFNPGQGQEIIAQKSSAGFRFATDSQKIVEWVAELKPLHAQRIAAYLGQEVSRVGLVESEWLRLLCDR